MKIALAAGIFVSALLGLVVVIGWTRSPAGIDGGTHINRIVAKIVWSGPFAALAFLGLVVIGAGLALWVVNSNN